MSQIGYQLGPTCDGGPAWPKDCLPFRGLLTDGWSGLRSEGALYTGAISLLKTSGVTIEEQLLLFDTPNSFGLKLLVQRATACKAVRGAAVSGAQVYRYPDQSRQQRYLVIDRTVAIMLQAPADLSIDKVLKLAVQRARNAK